MFGQEQTVGPAVQSGADKGKWIGPNEGGEGGKETTKPGVNGRESSGEGGSNGNGSGE